MQIHNVQQGSPEWDALRANHDTASEAPVIMGASPYMTRQDLIRLKAGVCDPEEISRFKQIMFDNGHVIEAQARVISERNLGMDLYPITATETVKGLNLLASLDGVDEDYCVIKFEHKQINKKLALVKTADDLSPLHYWQLEHQNLVVPCPALFVASDGTEENRIEVTYESRPMRRAELIAAWLQFNADLKAFKENPQAAPVEMPQGATVAELPEIMIELVADVKSNNLATYKDAALAQIANIKTDLVTDEDFADAEVMVKALGVAEKNIEAALQRALAQATDLNNLFKDFKEIGAALRDVRLKQTKSIKDKKSSRRTEIAEAAQAEYRKHIAEQQGCTNITVQFPAIDPLTAMKGKKTIKSLEDAAAQTLADGKLAANDLGFLVRTNLAFAESEAGDFKFLFHDMPALVVKQQDDFQAVIKARVAEHKEAERLKAERQAKAEQERIAREQAALSKQSAEPVATAPVNDPRPQQPAQPESVQQQPSRPADWQIVAALADYFETDNDTVVSWLCQLDLSEIEAAA